jgi:hypothetical protein
MSRHAGPAPTVDAPSVPTTDTEFASVTASNRRQVPVSAPLPRRRANGAVLFSLVCALAAAIGLLYLVQTSAIAGLGVELSALQREIDAQSVRNEELSYQLGYYESLPVVKRVAIEQQGMAPADSTLYLTAQRPMDDDVPLPEQSQPAEESLVQRLVNRLFGRAVESDPAPGANP